MALTGLPRGLTWDDFSEFDTAPDGGDEAAFTKADYSISYGYTQNGNTWSVTNVVIGVRINPSDSWVVTDSKISALLQHEQGHYDITALGARDLHRSLGTMTATSRDALLAAIVSLRTSTQLAINAMSVRYDGTNNGTNHGTDAAAQTRWSGRIASAIADPAATLAGVVP